MLKGLCLIVLSVLINIVPCSFAAEQRIDSLLSLSDIHFDPFISCQNKIPCPLILQLQKASAAEWPRILAAQTQDAPQYRQDTPYSLLISALQAASETANAKQVKFVIILGDFLGHDYRRFYKKYSNDKKAVNYSTFVNKTFQFLTQEINRAFPELNVYPVLGNNDSYRYDYASSPYGPFYSDLATLWSQTLIKNSQNRSAMRGEFAKAGYYAVTIPNQPNLRLIVLNTVLFSTHAKGQSVEQAAKNELKWLDQQLQMAKANHQKVFIAMHIPMSIDVYTTLRIKLFTLMELWKPAYLNSFKAELKQYAPEITAIFCGHLHSDWSHVLTFDEGEVALTGTPSISPFFGNNPGFKIYDYSSKNLELEDYSTYYYPLSGSKKWTTTSQISGAPSSAFLKENQL